MADLAEFRVECRRFLSAASPTLVDADGGSDFAVFHDLDLASERRLLEAAATWQRTKLAAGFGAIRWATEWGGRGLDFAHEQVFREEEIAAFGVPPTHELLRITVNLVAPAVRDLGTAAQQDRFVRPLLSCDQLACQLFSESEAGSDLANVRTRAERQGDEWAVNGAKVWTSGARLANWGILIARTDPGVVKHAGLTVFLVPMDAAGIEVRPIRQMSGGASFSEVYLTDVVLHDDLRLGPVGGGWRTTLTVLGYEREQSGSLPGVGGSWEDLLALARRCGRSADPVIRQRLAAVYTHERLRALTRARTTAARSRGAPAGPAGSIGKLLWSTGLTSIGELAGTLGGALVTADSGVPGAYEWTNHMLGAPGFRIAGGSDEIQRNIIAERVLGLPPEPRVDRDAPWSHASSSAAPDAAVGSH